MMLSHNLEGETKDQRFLKKDLVNKTRENANHQSCLRFHLLKGAVNPPWSRKVTGVS